MNLAVNARDAMPDGGTLSIKTANVDPGDECIRYNPDAGSGAYVMLTISDNGIGMDEETQANIFEPFFTTNAKGHGTGLVLSTVYGIVKQSEGFVRVFSRPGEGTTFRICFPRFEDRIPAQLEDGDVVRKLWGTGPVLVVEDDDSVRMLTTRILRDQGYRVLEAADGVDALRIAGEYTGEIHVLITDVGMPRMSGKDLADQMEVLRPGIKVLYVSGYTDDVIFHHWILDANIFFLQKPFSNESLAQKLREVINSEKRG